MHVIYANGAEIPALGLGTWELRGETCTRLVQEALEIGYRHVDTAAAYDNEREVGQAIRAAGVPRDQIFVTTKVWYDSLEPDRLVESAENSLTRLDLDHVDLLLIHWPSPTVPLEESLAAMAQLQESGCTRHIGVSNFPSDLLRRAVAISEVPIVVDQVEYHPFLAQTHVLEAARDEGVAVTAYSPLAQGEVNGSPVLEEIGRAHGKTAAQVALRWLVQQDKVAAIPRSSKPERLRENLDIFDFELTREEMQRVFGLARPDGRMVNVEWAPEWDSD